MIGPARFGIKKMIPYYTSHQPKRGVQNPRAELLSAALYFLVGHLLGFAALPIISVVLFHTLESTSVPADDRGVEDLLNGLTLIGCPGLSVVCTLVGATAIKMKDNTSDWQLLRPIHPVRTMLVGLIIGAASLLGFFGWVWFTRGTSSIFGFLVPILMPIAAPIWLTDRGRVQPSR